MTGIPACRSGRRSWQIVRRLVLALVVLSIAPVRAEAFDIWRSADGDSGVELTPSLKLFFFGVAGMLEGPDGYEEVWPVPDVGGGTLGRLRLRLVLDVTSRIRSVVHYEHRPRVLSSGRLLSSVSAALQGDEEMPFRLHPMVWEIASAPVEASSLDDVLGPASSTFVWEHEIDRLLWTFSLPGGIDITVGRQAIGWGLGRLWTPLDVFAPMTPTDLDREERRGIDAVRLSLSMSQSSMMEVVLVGGREETEDGEYEVTWDASALAWLLRVNVWDIDWMLMAGRVGPDRVIGAAVDGQVRGVGLRGEVAMTMDEERDRWVQATVGCELGTSFNLTAVVEYHYNGFGTLDTDDYVSRATRMASRMAAGRLSNLGQHYLGATLAWMPGSWGGISLVYIQNLHDGSLLLGPSLEYAISDEVRLSVVALVPIGADPVWTTDPETGVPELVAHSELGMAAQMYVISIRASI